MATYFLIGDLVKGILYIHTIAKIPLLVLPLGTDSYRLFTLQQIKSGIHNPL